MRDFSIVFGLVWCFLVNVVQIAFKIHDWHLRRLAKRDWPRAIVQPTTRSYL